MLHEDSIPDLCLEQDLVPLHGFDPVGVELLIIDPTGSYLSGIIRCLAEKG